MSGQEHQGKTIEHTGAAVDSRLVRLAGPWKLWQRPTESFTIGRPRQGASGASRDSTRLQWSDSAFSVT